MLIFLIISFLASKIVVSKNLYYYFDIYYFSGSPDGVLKTNILGVNGQFPGPVIRGKLGDKLFVTVTNKIQDGQNTTIHWHGLFQYLTPFNDGPNQITQCPIPNGKSQVYSFELKQTGTYWWHSHVDYQYTEGLWGPLIITDKYDPYILDYDDELLITLNDWYHKSGKENTAWFLSPESEGNEPIPDSVLINGRGRYPCHYAKLQNYSCNPLTQYPRLFEVYRGKRYRVRIINTSSLSSYNFSIDNHRLEVIEVDGVATVKVNTDVITIAPAQRYSCIIHVNWENTKVDKYWIRVQVLTDMYAEGVNINPFPEALKTEVLAVLKYKSDPYGCELRQPIIQNINHFETGVYVHDHVGEFYYEGGNKTLRYLEEDCLKPLDRISAPNHFDQEIKLRVVNVVDNSGVNHLTFDGKIYRIGNIPALALLLNNQTIPESLNPHEVKFHKPIQIVLNNNDTGPHPFHLHGHTFHVIGKGEENAEDYDATRDKDKIRLDGVRRDTVTVNANSWLVLRFISNNPGAWVFHCHIQWHMQAGLAALFVEGAKEAKKVLTIPNETKKICHFSGISI